MLLYHYCSVETMMKIIEGRHIWLCNALKSNDRKEYFYFYERLEQYVKSNFAGDTLANTILGHIYDNLYYTYMPYVSCFSTESDLLSQWSMYGNGGTGVAIGVHSERLSANIPGMSSNLLQVYEIENVLSVDFNIHEPFFAKINYDIAKTDGILQSIFSEYLKRFKDTSPSDFNKAYKMGNDIMEKICLCAILCKHPGFKAEQEYRIGYIKEANGILSKEAYGYYQKNNTLTRYIKLYFNISESVETLILGPKCNIDANDPEFIDFTFDNEIPYRFECSQLTYK